jgi:hypothetical protein
MRIPISLLLSILAPTLSGACLLIQVTRGQANPAGIPVIDVTDTYHPFQDRGDNFDLIMAYGLPEVDLKAIVLDVTDAFRKPVADHPILYRDPHGPREAGIIPVLQLNYIFDRNVRFGMGPFSPMKSPGDGMREVANFQQQGVELILEVLRESDEPVHIVSFGSARPVAVAFNREPALFHSQVKRIHLSAGTASKGYELGNSRSHNEIPGGEWNVALDPIAFSRLMQSDLPIAIYPCATKDGAYELGNYNTYWKLPNLHFVRQMQPKLQRYLDFALARLTRVDFLRAMDGPRQSDFDDKIYDEAHHVWETAIWTQVSERVLVRRANGRCQLLPKSDVLPTDTVIPQGLKPCKITVRDDGRFDFELTDQPTNFAIYERADPQAIESALQEALPDLYMSLRIP